MEWGNVSQKYLQGNEYFQESGAPREYAVLSLGQAPYSEPPSWWFVFECEKKKKKTPEKASDLAVE